MSYNKIKILVIHNKYQSNNIGGEDIVYENELLSLREELGFENVYCYEVSNDNINKLSLLFNIWFSLKHFNNIKRMVSHNNIDLVHIHNFYPILTPSIFKASKEAGAKVVHTLHNYRLWCISGIFYRDGHGICELCIKKKFPIYGILNKCYRDSLIQSVLAQFSFWFYRSIKAFDSIDYFFVLTNFQKDKIRSLGIEKDKIILKPNGLGSMPSTIETKDGYIYVGRIEESKGICELLRVWKKLPQKFSITIIGSGKLERDLKEKYQSLNIIFKGKCSRLETLECISKSKYLIQPSILYETFGLTMIEAMGLGTPVIGFDIGTRSDFIEDKINGFLCNPDTLEEVVKKSFDYGNYNSLRENSSLKAKAFEKNYVVKKQIEIYRDIINE
jgi:glycosyltransferase involved in cell wall biosynthesis